MENNALIKNPAVPVLAAILESLNPKSAEYEALAHVISMLTGGK